MNTSQYSLNTQQRNAATHLQGPALVLAGPGTGKTHTLIGHYLDLVDRGVKPGHIFTVTFTKKAASELKERIGHYAQIETRTLPIGTFHALCMRVLRNHGHLLGMKSDFKLIHEGQIYHVVRDLKKDLPGELEDYIAAISNYKDNIITPDEAIDIASRKPEAIRYSLTQYARIYKAYQEALQRAELYDYGDLIFNTIKLFRNHPATRNDLCSKWHHILCDEYQDINKAQHDLINEIMRDNPAKDLWVVGDDDQAIYAWRGSDIKYIRDFHNTYPNTQTYTLIENYRSAKSILSAARITISKIGQRYDKELTTTNTSTTPVVACEAANEYAEAEWIAQSVKTLLEKGMAPSEITVLFRTNYLSLQIESAFQAKKIEYIVRGAGNYWKSAEVVKSLETLRNVYGIASITTGGLSRLDNELAEIIKLNKEEPFAAMAAAICAVVGESPPLTANKERVIQWHASTDMIASIAQEYTDAPAFFGHITRLMQKKPKNQSNKAVLISSIHAAKGLEWKAVFVAALNEGIMPHGKSENEDEERRLAYVAFTRAKQVLSLSTSRERNGAWQEKSPYLEELLASLPDKSLSLRQYPAKGQQIERPKVAYIKRNVFPGQNINGKRVYHTAFGQGIISNVSGDNWTVSFRKTGVRTIKKEFLKLLN